MSDRGNDDTEFKLLMERHWASLPPCECQWCDLKGSAIDPLCDFCMPCAGCHGCLHGHDDPESQCICPRTCNYCGAEEAFGAPPRILLRCGRCRDAYYCNRECQRRDWKSHKPSCYPSTLPANEDNAK